MKLYTDTKNQPPPGKEFMRTCNVCTLQRVQTILGSLAACPEVSRTGVLCLSRTQRQTRTQPQLARDKPLSFLRYELFTSRISAYLHACA